MNYNSYLPNYNYQQPNTGIVWVQGLEGAKAYPVAIGNSIILMDSESPCFYMKSADANGVPTLKIYDYKERVEDTKSEYITRKEFEEYINNLKAENGDLKEKTDE